MFPIRDHNPSGRTPYVVYTLVLLNVAIFLTYTVVLSGNGSLGAFYDQWALTPSHITSGQDFETLITSLFLHGGFMHLAGNMLFLWIFGDNMEDEMGHIPFLLFYLLSGIGAGLIHVMAAPGSVVPTVGASGAIAGVMGGYLLMFPKARVDILLILIVFFKVFPIPAWVMLGVWLGMQFLGSASADPDTGGIAYWAHTGGFAVGLILTIPIWLKRGGIRFWNQTHGQPPHPEKQYKLSNSRIPKVARK